MPPACHIASWYGDIVSNAGEARQVRTGARGRKVKRQKAVLGGGPPAAGRSLALRLPETQGVFVGLLDLADVDVQLLGLGQLIEAPVAELPAETALLDAAER